MELFEEIRREYEFGVGTIKGVARKLGVHRRMVREAVASALPPPRKKPARRRAKLAPASMSRSPRPPRSDCPEHGPRVVRLPWAEVSSRFTVLFEALAISWLKEASQQGVAELLALSWDVRIQWVKATARGFRNQQNFINAIYFHCGGLDMAPGH